MANCWVRGFEIFMVSVSVLVAAPGREGVATGPPRAEKARVIAVRSVGSNGSKEAITVDTDGRILLVEINSGGSKKYVKTLDYEADVPNEFPASALISKHQAITTVRKLTCSTLGWRLWFIVTLGFPPPSAPSGAGVSNFVYVFQETQQKTKTLLSQYFGIVTDFVIDDISGDGSKELVIQHLDQTAMSPSTWLDIWQVTGEGSLQTVSLDNVAQDLDLPYANSSRIELSDYRNGDTGIYSEQSASIVGGRIVVRKGYRWNHSARRYHLVETTKTEEHQVR